MLRRLFFLFPNESKAQAAVDQLIFSGLKRRHIHAIAQNVELTTLPAASERQKADTTFKLERILWLVNLLVFSIALVCLLISFPLGSISLAIASFVVMAISFIGAEQFVVHVPNVHLTEFTDALSHGEILLMIDLPYFRVNEIETYIRCNHPEAVVGGVGWTLDAFGM